MGVTLATYEYYCRLKKYPKPTVEQLKKMDESTWDDIFKTLYWDRWRADQIKDQRIANILVDWVSASGLYGIKIPQRLIEVTPDGKVGPVTIARLNKLIDEDKRELANQLLLERVRFVDRIIARNPRLMVFRKGWLNRINGL